MATKPSFIAGTASDTMQILDLVERAQAIAAQRVQEYTKMGFSASLIDSDFTGMPYTKQEFIDAISSLMNLFPNILGDHGTNLYRLKE